MHLSLAMLAVKQRDRSILECLRYTSLGCLQFCQSLSIGDAVLFTEESQGLTEEPREEDSELDTTGQRLEQRWRLEM